MLDWVSNESHLLLNPYHPFFRKREEIFKKLPELPGHIWLATSGTTAQDAGSLKLVALSKKAFLIASDSVNKHLQVCSSDRWGNILPNFHVGGLSLQSRAFLSGADYVELKNEESKWSAISIYESMQEKRVSLTAMVPAQLYDFLTLELSSPPNLRAALVGGDFLSNSLYQKGRELGWPLIACYGATETCALVAAATIQSLRQSEGPILKKLPHCKIKSEKSGELHFSGESLFTCYVYCSGKGIRSFDPKENGWWASSDLGEISGEFIEFQGRSADLIKVGGERVNLFQLRLLLSQMHHQIPEEVTLTSHPNERLGSVVSLVVSSRVDKPEKIAALFNEKVMPFERIQKIKIAASIGKLQ